MATITDCVDPSHVIGIGKFKKLYGKGAQRVVIKRAFLEKVLKSMKSLDIEKIVITVENDMPILIGGISSGFIIAPEVDPDDELHKLHNEGE